MHLYTPIDGRSVVVGEYIISSTGMQFDNPVPCLEEALGTLLMRSGDMEYLDEPVPEVEIESD